MRADRLLSILLLLQRHGRVTARELADRLEVSVRTINRDMEALGMAGVPITAKRGTGGGWMLPNEYRTDVSGLNEAEIHALFLSNPDRLLADLGLRQAAERGTLKLLSGLPPGHQHDAEKMRQRMHIDVSGWRHSEEAVPFLPQLHAALIDDRRIAIAYARPGAEPSERTLDPLGLVAKGSIWYLICAVEGEPRTYRVSRISRVELLDERAARPDGFDLAAYWEASKSSFVERLPRYHFTALVTARALDEIRLMGHWSSVVSTEPECNEACSRVTIRSERFEDALGLAMGLGAEMEVLAPPELRLAVIGGAAATLARYGAAGETPEPSVVIRDVQCRG